MVARKVVTGTGMTARPVVQISAPFSAEDIEVLRLPFAEALKMVETGEIADAKTILLLQYAALKDLLA